MMMMVMTERRFLPLGRFPMEVWPLAALVGSVCSGSFAFACYAAASKPDACFDKRRRAQVLKN